MASLPALTPSMLKARSQVDHLETHDKCTSTDTLVTDLDTGAFSISKIALPDVMVTHSDMGAYPGTKFMVHESAAQSEYDSVSHVGVENDQCVLPVPNFFDPIKLTRNQASSCHQSSSISHIPRANSVSSNRIKATYVAGRVATSCSKKRGHEFMNVLKKRGSKKAKKQNDFLISIHPDDEKTALIASAKSSHTPRRGHHVVFVDRGNPSNPKINPVDNCPGLKKKEVIVLPVSCFKIPLYHIDHPHRGLMYRSTDGPK